MIITISGGSGSGKSAIGETIACCLQPQEKTYIATMESFGKEAKSRIAKHQAMRKNKNFTTVEKPTNLLALTLDSKSTVMLECVSNLVANEIFSPTGCGLANAEEKIKQALQKLANTCENMIIVTNEIFSDGLDYDQTTKDYIRTLGKINCFLAEISDVFIEAVYTIPVIHKGNLPQTIIKKITQTDNDKPKETPKCQP